MQLNEIRKKWIAGEVATEPGLQIPPSAPLGSAQGFKKGRKWRISISSIYLKQSSKPKLGRGKLCKYTKRF